MEGGAEPPGSPSKPQNEQYDVINLQLDELDDTEFDLPPVGTPPTLESILNQPDEESLSDEEFSTQLPNEGAGAQNQMWNVESPDTTSIASLESSESSKARSISRRTQTSPRLLLQHGSIIKHVILRGVTSQMVSAAERVKVGKPSAMAVSNMIAIGTTHGVILIFDVKQVMKWCLGSNEIGEQHGSVSALCFNSDCSRLLVGHAKGLISKWDIATGKLLQNIQDVHPIGTAVLHMFFIDDHTRAIFSDSGGSVFELNFKKSIGGRSCVSQCLFSGSRGEVCTVQPLLTNQYHDHPLKPYDLVAMGTMSKVIVIALKPTIHVLFSHPLLADQSALPLVSWQFVIIQMTNSNRVIDPVLTFGRQDTIYFFQVTESQPKSIHFIPLQKMILPFTILNFSWLNSRTFAVFDTNEVLHVVDVRSEEPLEILDISNVNMVYNSSHFKALSTGGNVSKAMALIGERACYQTLKIFNGQLLILGTRSVHVMTIRTWHERIDHLANRNKFKASLALATSFYEDKAKAVVGLKGNREQRRQSVVLKIQDLIVQYSASIVTHSKQSNYSESQLEEYFRESIPICVEYCFQINHMDLLFETVYEKASMNPVSRFVFLECLEPFILNDRLQMISPMIVQQFVEHYERRQMFMALEACIIHLDITSLDIHQIMTLSWKHNMYDSIFYIYNNGMMDFVTPLKDLLVILMKAVDTGKQLSDEHIKLGNKLFVYISCCLSGIGCPRKEQNPDTVAKIREDVLQVITCPSTNESSEDGEEYPYLKTLLKYDTREFLNVLSMAFQEPDFCQGPNGDNRQILVDMLLRIMVNSSDFTPLQVGALFTFLARHLAKVDCGIVVNHMLFEQVLEYLTNAGDETRLEERQQTLMDLYQAGGLVRIDDKKLLALAEKAQFYRICELLYEEKRSFDKVLTCYLRDPIRQGRIFTFIKHIHASAKFSNHEKKSVETECMASIKQLVEIDCKKTAKLIVSIYPHTLAQLIAKLQGVPELQYKFLRGIFEYHEENFRPTTSQPGKDGEADNQPIIEASVHEKYISLMCKYNINGVAQHVKNNEGYRLQEALDICQKYQATDAVAFLLEKAGDVQGAFKIMLKSVEEAVQHVCDWVTNNSNPMAKMEDTVEWGVLQTSLVYIIQLCQRNCPKMKEQEREALWFPLFEALTIPQRKFKDTHSAYFPVFKELTRYLLNSMMGYIAVSTILEKIMKDPAYSSGKLGEVRDMIMGMLETYSYEQTLLHLTNNLLCSDLHNQLSSLRTIANKGYSSHSNMCSLCHKAFTSSMTQAIVFRCGHLFHVSCIMEKEPSIKNLYQQNTWLCLLCSKLGSGKSNKLTKNKSPPASSSDSRTSQRASAYLQAASQQPLLKTSPSKTKMSLDHNQIQALDYLRRTHRTNSRLAVLSELSRTDAEQTVSPVQRASRASSSIFKSEDFSLKLSPSGQMPDIDEL